MNKVISLGQLEELGIQLFDLYIDSKRGKPPIKPAGPLDRLTYWLKYRVRRVHLPESPAIPAIPGESDSLPHSLNPVVQLEQARAFLEGPGAARFFAPDRGGFSLPTCDEMWSSYWKINNVLGEYLLAHKITVDGHQGKKVILEYSLVLWHILTNSLAHGNSMDPSRKIVIRWLIGHAAVQIQIEDQGEWLFGSSRRVISNQEFHISGFGSGHEVSRFTMKQYGGKLLPPEDLFFQNSQIGHRVTLLFPKRITPEQLE